MWLGGTKECSVSLAKADRLATEQKVYLTLHDENELISGMHDLTI
jgi:hypothetical protein